MVFNRRRLAGRHMGVGPNRPRCGNRCPGLQIDSKRKSLRGHRVECLEPGMIKRDRLLRQAREARAQAAKAHRLAMGTNPTDCAQLIAYSQELDGRARDLEGQASKSELSLPPVTEHQQQQAQQQQSAAASTLRPASVKQQRDSD